MPDCASSDDIWLPDQSEQGHELFNCYKRLVLVEGPRLSGKSLSICHRVWRHLWETPNGFFGIFAKTIKSAKEGGSWNDMVKIIGPQWMASGMVGEHGMPIEYLTHDGTGEPGPRQDGTTRTHYFKIRNYHGGQSECYLFSLDNDNEIEAKTRNMRFSGEWFVELSNFKSRAVFDNSILILRRPGLRFDQHMWIADTNPAPEGKDSWIYKLFHIEKHQEPPSDLPEKKRQELKNHRNNLHVVKFTLDGNMKYLDPQQRVELEGTYANDPGEYARNVLGEWVRGKGGSEKHFSDLIKPDLHYIPNSIDIPPETVELLTGWDTGDVNHAAVILEERIVNGNSVFLVHEELEVLGQEISLEQFAYDFYQKIIGIEEFYKREFQWEHWSDDTATTAFRSAIGGYDASLILKATQGRVEIQGADKPEGSIAHSIRIIRKLLREHRLFVSETCPQVKRMLEEIEQPNTTPELTVDKYNPLKHIFDALRYPIYMRIRWESFANRPESVKRTGVISI